MVNNSTKINKANNDLSPQTIEHKKTTTDKYEWYKNVLYY